MEISCCACPCPWVPVWTRQVIVFWIRHAFRTTRQCKNENAVSFWQLNTIIFTTNTFYNSKRFGSWRNFARLSMELFWSVLLSCWFHAWDWYFVICDFYKFWQFDISCSHIEAKFRHQDKTETSGVASSSRQNSLGKKISFNLNLGKAPHPKNGSL